MVVDTLRVPRESFAAIIEAWRDGYAESIAQLTTFARESAVAYFDQMIENIRNATRYAVWMVPVVSAQNPIVRRGLSIERGGMSALLVYEVPSKRPSWAHVIPTTASKILDCRDGNAQSVCAGPPLKSI